MIGGQNPSQVGISTSGWLLVRLGFRASGMEIRKGSCGPILFVET
jgi:hypothetical protein